MKLEEIYVLVLGQASKWWTDQINIKTKTHEFEG
jgi:hypothetical protein